MTAGRDRRLHSAIVLLLIVFGLVVAPGCLWGVVRDADTGAPINGAQVQYTDSYGHTGVAYTDAHGLYAFDQAAGPIPAAGPVTLDVSAPGYAPVSVPFVAQYNDHDVATLSNLSTFWEVQHVNLTSSAPAVNPDLAVTDLYPDNQPSGILWAQVVNNGPDTIDHVPISLSCGYERTNKTSCNKDTLNPIVIPVNLALFQPGDKVFVNTGIGLDTGTYWYRATCTVVPLNPYFGDPNPTNDTYLEVIPPATGDLELQQIGLGFTNNEVYFRVSESGLAGTHFCWDVALGTHAEKQACDTVVQGSSVFWTGLYVNGSESVAAAIWPCLPETNEFNNQIVQTLP
jgi:hypothetical protein